MDKGTILLILNGVFALFLVLGFLFGLKGIKKSGLRLGFFFVAAILAFIFTPMISKAIMQINITYQGSSMVIQDVLLTLIKSSPEIAEITASSTALEQLFVNFPLMIGNVVVFVVLFYVLNLVSWIIYMIIASAVFKKDKEVIKETGKKPKKFRLLGGLVGAVQALILVCLTFLYKN